jgi:hypothetical protein
MTTFPEDFTIRYEWREGSLPPPHHYEYSIILGPDGQGQVVMQPDYPGEGTPTWSEVFLAPPAEMERLFRCLVSQGLFTQRWRQQEDPPVGGSSQSLRATVRGRAAHVPFFVLPAQAAAVEEMCVAVKAIVPQAIWKKLYARREQYRRKHQA